MPWFYFDLREETTLQRDEEGLPLADVDEAEREAVAAALTMARDTFEPLASARGRSLVIEVREGEGAGDRPVTKVSLKLDVSRT